MTTTVEFTPGPWKPGFIADSDGKLVWQSVEAPDGFSIATVGRYLHRYESGSRRPMREIRPEEASANVLLIAAAPNMLAALKFAYAHCDPTPGREKEWRCILDAIDKATLNP